MQNYPRVIECVMIKFDTGRFGIYSKKISNLDLYW
jgi:hypothetical protein